MAIIEERQHAPVPGRHAYRTLLVYVEPGAGSGHRVETAAVLARDLGAYLMGLGAATFKPFLGCEPIEGSMAADVVGIMQARVSQDLKQAEETFRRQASSADAGSEWRRTQDIPNEAVARAARAADLIIAGPRSSAGFLGSLDPAELVFEAGRPVLIVPLGAPPLKGARVVIAWKDTREARRAVADALPLLQRASDVIVQAICPVSESREALYATQDVVAALERNGVTARALVAQAADSEVADALRTTARENGADLIVAGAFGYRRAHDWLFGGVTRMLVHAPPCFVLLSR
jgi:nucleotide-binding universal stress UspA family protein